MTKTKKHILILAVYVFLTILMTFPVVVNLTTHLAATGGDAWQTMWRFEHKWDELITNVSNNHLLEYAKNEFLGGGEARLVNLSVWPWMPLFVIFGQPLSYNLIWLLSFVLSGYFMYLLVRQLLKNSDKQVSPFSMEAGAFIAGMVYMFLPYHVAHAQGHFGAMQLQWLPLSILVLILFLKKPNWKTGLGLILSFVIQAWTEHHYFLWLAVFCVIFISFERKTVRRFFKIGSWSKYVYLIIFPLLVLFSYLPTVRLALNSETLSLGAGQLIRFSADLFSFVVPASFQTIWGGLFHVIFSQSFTGNISEATQYLGVVLILLVIFFHQKIPKHQKIFWFSILGIFLCISLGPKLHVFGRVLSIPLPYALIDSLPVISSVRAIGRAGAMVGLSFSVLVGWVVATQMKSKKIIVILAGLILLEFMFAPVAMQSTEMSEIYDTVKNIPESAIIDLPAATNYTASSRALYVSVKHGKHIVGNIALERAQDKSVLQEIRSLPVLRQLIYLRTTHLREDRADFFNQKLTETLPDVLRWLDVGAIVIHKDSLSVLQNVTLNNFLTEDMGYMKKETKDAEVYVVDSQKGDGVFLSRDSSWQNVGFDKKRNSVFAEIPRKANITLYNVDSTDYQVRLSFSIAPESHGNMLIKQEGKVVSDLIKQGGEKAEVNITVRPGKTIITFVNRLTDKIIIQNPEVRVVR